MAETAAILLRTSGWYTLYDMGLWSHRGLVKSPGKHVPYCMDLESAFDHEFCGRLKVACCEIEDRDSLVHREVILIFTSKNISASEKIVRFLLGYKINPVQRSTWLRCDTLKLSPYTKILYNQVGWGIADYNKTRWRCWLDKKLKQIKGER